MDPRDPTRLLDRLLHRPATGVVHKWKEETGPRDLARRLLPEWQRRLRLGDWMLAVSDLEPGKGERSTIDLHTSIRQAAIRLRSDTPLSQVERQLVHELLHARLALMSWAWRDARSFTPEAFDRSNETLWSAGEEAAIEALCDALGCAPRAAWGIEDPEWKAAFPVQEDGDASS